MLEVEQLEVVEVELEVVESDVDVVLEVEELLEDDVQGLEVVRLLDVLILWFLQLEVSSGDVLLLEVVEVLSCLEVDVIAELRPIDVLQEAEVMLFFSR